MKKEAELYLKSNYKAEWRPRARTEKILEAHVDKCASSSPLVSSSSCLLAPNNGNKKEGMIYKVNDIVLNLTIKKLM
jgi:hypothetical protein